MGMSAMLENRMVADSEWTNAEPAQYVHCDCCGKELYYGDVSYEADNAYGLDGYTYCEDCFDRIAKERFFLRLGEVGR